MTNLSTGKLIQIPDGLEKAAEFTEFCKWAAQPKDVRTPSEQKELTKVLNVDEATLSLWKRHPEFVSNRNYFIREWLGEDMPAVMDVVKKYALRGNLGHIQTMLKWLGELVDSPQVAIQNNTTINNYSKEELLEEAYRIVAEDKGITVEELKG